MLSWDGGGAWKEGSVGNRGFNPVEGFSKALLSPPRPSRARKNTEAQSKQGLELALITEVSVLSSLLVGVERDV